MWTELREEKLKEIKDKTLWGCRRLTAILRDTSGNPFGNLRPTERAAFELCGYVEKGHSGSGKHSGGPWRYGVGINYSETGGQL